VEFWQEMQDELQKMVQKLRVRTAWLMRTGLMLAFISFGAWDT
jgi:hypothetical protein